MLFETDRNGTDYGMQWCLPQSLPHVNLSKSYKAKGITKYFLLVAGAFEHICCVNVLAVYVRVRILSLLKSYPNDNLIATSVQNLS